MDRQFKECFWGRELELSATVEIEGLPTGCMNIITESFKIGFVTVIRDPPKIDEFGRITIAEERKRFDVIASGFKECEGCSMTIILYSSSNNKQNIKNRIARISSYLKAKHNIPENSCEFINGGTGKYSTEI